MSGRVRVLVYATAPDQDSTAVVTAYHEISRALNGTAGLLGNELLRSLSGDGRWMVMSEWGSLEAFRAWEEGAEHRDTTAPLRPLQDRERVGPFGLYEVVATY